MNTADTALSRNEVSILTEAITNPPGVFAVHSVDEVDTMDRHRWLVTFSQLIHLMCLGAASDAALSGPTRLKGAAIVALPSWTWVIARTNVGQKKSKHLLPARLVWDVPQVVLCDRPVNARWATSGLGYHHSGTTTIRPVDSSLSAHGGSQDTSTPLPAMVAATRVSGARVRTSLEEMSHTGSNARWLALEFLRGSVTEAVNRARVSVAYDLDPEVKDPKPVFDDIVAEMVVTEMLYGSSADGLEKSAPIWRLLDRCMQPGAFASADPFHVVAKTVYRDAIDATRAVLGDPRVGTRVRAVARELGTTDVDQVVAEFRVRYPQDRLSHSRATQALTLGPDVSAQTIKIDDGRDAGAAREGRRS